MYLSVHHSPKTRHLAFDLCLMRKSNHPHDCIWFVWGHDRVHAEQSVSIREIQRLSSHCSNLLLWFTHFIYPTLIIELKVFCFVCILLQSIAIHLPYLRLIRLNNEKFNTFVPHLVYVRLHVLPKRKVGLCKKTELFNITDNSTWEYGVWTKDTSGTHTHTQREWEWEGEKERYAQRRNRKEMQRMPKEMEWMPVATQGNSIYVIS